MNKKIIAGLLSAAAVGTFWACGSGSINEPDAMTDGIVSMQFNSPTDADTTKARKINENLIIPAKEACKADINCYAANQRFVDSGDQLPVASSSSEAPVGGNSSMFAPRSSSSRAIGTGTLPTSSESGDDPGQEIPASSASKTEITGLGTCATTTGAKEANKGDQIQFLFTANPDRKNEIAQMQLAGRVVFDWNYGTGTGTAVNAAKSSLATFATSGDPGVSVTVSMGDEISIVPCDIHINGAPITCTCTSPETSVDFTATPDVTWTAACTTDAAFMPLTYEWDGTPGEATFTKTFTIAQDGYVPTLKVGNQDNTLTTVTTCTKVKTTKGAEFTFEKSDTKVRLPAGESNVVLDLPATWHNGTEGTCTLRCDGANQPIVITVGAESSKADYSATLSIPIAKTINKSSLVIGLDVSADCQISY